VTRVKICGIRDIEHVRAALDAGAELLGFVFYRPSHRYVTPAQAATLIAQARREYGRGWQAVGLFVNEAPEVVEQVAEACALDLVQLSGDEDRAYCRRLRVPLVKVVRPAQVGQAPLRVVCDAAYWGAERVLLDAHVAGRYGGTGQPLPWVELREVAGPCLLAGGLTPDNVGAAVLAARPWGVDVSSGVERDRVKDPALIRRFISEVRRADERCEARSGA